MTNVAKVINDNEVSIRCTCPICGEYNYVTVNKKDYDKHLENPRAFVNDLYPYLSVDDRELLISGTCSKCWDEIFADMGDEEEDE